MINELKDVGHEMTNAQKVQVVIHYLPSNWEHVHANITYNDNIKIFDDVAHHVELEENRLHAEKPVNKAFISETNICGAYDSKY
jgi:ligand-binding SRPBCC domain-containing protein